MAHQVRLADEAIVELKAIRVFDRRRIVEQVKVQLAHEPTKPTRHRKCLGAMTADGSDMNRPSEL